MRWYIERKACPACHNPDTKIIFTASLCDAEFQDYLSRYYHPNDITQYSELCEVPYQLDECLRCGTIFQHYILNDTMMGVLYEEWISPDMSFGKEIKNTNLLTFSRITQEIMTAFSFLNKPNSELEVLDFGMGWGYWCRVAMLLGAQVYGTELSQSRLQYAEKYNIKVLTLDELEQKKFDFINTEQVFEHLPKPLETLQELRGMLKPNGIVKISVPNGKFAHKILQKELWKKPANDFQTLKIVTPLEHINCYQQKSLPIMAQQAGLEPVRIPLRIRLSNIVGFQLIEMLRQVSRTFKPGTYQFFRRVS